MKRNSIYLFCVLFLVSCSMTKNIPDDDQLFTGLKKITYHREPSDSSNFTATQEEVEASLATAPNGAILGSSYYRVPFSLGVSIWNRYKDSETGFGKWMFKSFGKQPVLMSWVNPALRASVAQSVLRNHGYLNGHVDYEVIQRPNPKTAKISYSVYPDRLYLLDSIGYFGFPADADSLIQANLDDAKIHRGSPFAVAALDAERNRISQLLRNNGYY